MLTCGLTKEKCMDDLSLLLNSIQLVLLAAFLFIR
jgi:hypothetical protein